MHHIALQCNGVQSWLPLWRTLQMHQAIYILQCNLTPHSNREECRRMSGSVQSSAIDCDCGGLLSLGCTIVLINSFAKLNITKDGLLWRGLMGATAQQIAIDCDGDGATLQSIALHCNWLHYIHIAMSCDCDGTTLQQIELHSHCNLHYIAMSCDCDGTTLQQV